MKMPDNLSTILVAPCGMNCLVCAAYLRKKKSCLGCRGPNESIPLHCRNCKIKACAMEQSLNLCYECSTFPCTRLKRLDKNYQQRYHVSLIENARYLQNVGSDQYLHEEHEKWRCVACGSVVCLHDRVCSECGKFMPE
ncbi:MAG: DUF3795 domain-containing protein [Candidatus Zixiibacteriota bacterium]|nr:MAG: DUF3795 domain-containing protein [candidate division Zixibacteria bacterium]